MKKKSVPNIRDLNLCTNVTSSSELILFMSLHVDYIKHSGGMYHLWQCSFINLTFFLIPNKAKKVPHKSFATAII